MCGSWAFGFLHELMWKDFGVNYVNWSTFCILDEYPRAGVDALSIFNKNI